jgi:DNA-binding Xre family transcriptional regulator
MSQTTVPFSAQLTEFLRRKGMTKEEFKVKYDISGSTLRRLLAGEMDNLRAITLAKVERLKKLKSWPHEGEQTARLRRTSKKQKQKLITEQGPQKVTPVTEPVQVHRVHSLDDVQSHTGNPETPVSEHVMHAAPETAVKLPEGVAGFEALRYIIAANAVGEDAARTQYRRGSHPGTTAGVHSLAHAIHDSPYVPRDLMLFVTRYPSEMSQEERDMIRTLFETEALRFEGVVAGHEVAIDDKSKRFMPYNAALCNPSIDLREKFGKPVNALLESWFYNCINGRSREEIALDGLDVIAIEPDQTLTRVLSAWHLRGIVPANTGTSSQRLDSEHSSQVSDVVYHVPLLADVIQTKSVKDWGQRLLNHVNARATEAANQRK